MSITTPVRNQDNRIIVESPDTLLRPPIGDLDHKEITSPAFYHYLHTLENHKSDEGKYIRKKLADHKVVTLNLNVDPETGAVKVDASPLADMKRIREGDCEIDRNINAIRVKSLTRSGDRLYGVHPNKRTYSIKGPGLKRLPAKELTKIVLDNKKAKTSSLEEDIASNMIFVAKPVNRTLFDAD